MTLGITLSLIIVGVILIVAEIFLIPGFGFAGLLGLLLMLGGIFSAAQSFAQGVIYLIITFLVIGLIVYVGWKTGRLKSIWGKVTLGDKQNSKEGYVAPKPEYSEYIGKTGTALTHMRPAGSAEIEGERVDCVTEGDYIERGALVKVVAVHGTRIIVRKYHEADNDKEVKPE